jgi:hypothetical protein
MPDEYEALVEALKTTDIPFVEYGWKNQQTSTYGVVSLDFEDESEEGSDEKLDRSWQASVDVFFYRLSERKTIVETIENVLRSVCGSGWWLNSIQHESNPDLFHYEWVCDVMNDTEEEKDEDDAVPDEG